MLLALPSLASAQETDPIPGLGLPSLDLDLSLDIPGVGPNDIEAAIADAHEAIASGISEALITTAADIFEPLDPDDDDDALSGIAKMLHDTAMAIIRKIGG